jgi:hypothetical protein
MWVDDYNWDNDTHRFPLHQELTQKHIFPNSAPAMWNKLAFEHQPTFAIVLCDFQMLRAFGDSLLFHSIIHRYEKKL